MHVTGVRKLTQRQWVNLFEAKWEHTGPPKEGEKKAKTRKGKWLFCSRRQRPQYTNPTHPDAVTVIPITEEDNPRVILVKEFRPPLQGYIIAFPAGLVEKGETAEAAGRRELPEETGYEITTVTKISPTVFTSPGLTDESGSLMFCRCKPTGKGPAHEAAEDMAVLELTFDGVVKLLEDVEASRERMAAKCWLILNSFVMQGRLA